MLKDRKSTKVALSSFHVRHDTDTSLWVIYTIRPHKRWLFFLITQNLDMFLCIYKYPTSSFAVLKWKPSFTKITETELFLYERVLHVDIENVLSALSNGLCIHIILKICIIIFSKFPMYKILQENEWHQRKHQFC